MKIVTAKEAIGIMDRYDSDALEALGLDKKLAKGVSALRGKPIMDSEAHLSVVLHILVAFASGDHEEAEALTGFLCLHMSALKMEQQRIEMAEARSSGKFNAPSSVN